jgi:hypothetical protein
MARMGHCSPKMQQHHTHITEQAQRACCGAVPFSRSTRTPGRRTRATRGGPATLRRRTPHGSRQRARGAQKNGSPSTTDKIQPQHPAADLLKDGRQGVVVGWGSSSNHFRVGNRPEMPQQKDVYRHRFRAVNGLRTGLPPPPDCYFAMPVVAAVVLRRRWRRPSSQAPLPPSSRRFDRTHRGPLPRVCPYSNIPILFHFD